MFEISARRLVASGWCKKTGEQGYRRVIAYNPGQLNKKWECTMGTFDWSNAIRARLAALGVSQVEVLEATGWSRGNWTRIMGGDNPTVDTVRRVGLALGLPASVVVTCDPALYCGAEPPPEGWLAQLAADRAILGFGATRAMCPDWPEWVASLNHAEAAP